MKSQEPSIAQQRKNDHVHHALKQQDNLSTSEFDRIRFVHHSINTTKFDNIDLSTCWAGHHHAFPFYINGMTGGSQFTKQFNDRLSQVAQQTGLAMASGSVSAALKDPSVEDSYRIIRQNHPQGFILANIGAHQTLDNAKRAVDILEANALQIHLNIPQEVVMPEGDRDFSNWAENIQKIVAQVGVPVIVKEVGFGMSQEILHLLKDLGVQTIDISGRGGTNFLTIENSRRDQLDFSALANWGQTAPESLLEAQSLIRQGCVEILASGGIRHFTDIVKAFAMGAQGVGLSGSFLKMVHDQGVDPTVQLIEQWKKSIQLHLLLLGCQNMADLSHTQIVLDSQLTHWAQVRGIDIQHFNQPDNPQLPQLDQRPFSSGGPYFA